MLIKAPPRYAAAIRHRARLIREVLIGCDQHPTLAGAQNFSVLKAERARDPKAAGPLASPFRAMRLGGIFNQQQIALPADRSERIHVAHRAAEMDRHHSLGLR